MKVTAAFVTSLNGKITKGEDPYASHWASKEDQKFFGSLIDKHHVIVMGRGTYDAVKGFLRTTVGKRRVVMTKKPQEFKDQELPKRLEFTKESPSELVRRMTRIGYNKILVVGGSYILTLFLKEKALDELYITLEPKLFGEGKDLVLESLQETDLKLFKVKKLNKKGTLLLHYKIER